MRWEERGPCPDTLILVPAALFGRTDGREMSYLLSEVLIHHHWQAQEAGDTGQVPDPFLPGVSQEPARTAVLEFAVGSATVC